MTRPAPLAFLAPRPRRALAALALVALASCATVSRARAAQDPASAVPGERTPTAAEMGLPTKGPVALRALVAAALRAHPSVVSARRAAEAAEARVREAEAGFYPEASVNGSAGLRTSSGSGGPSENRFVSYGFDVSWLLFDFGERSALARQAGHDWLAAQEDLRSAEVNAAFLVRSAYFDLGKQLDVLATDREAVRQFQEHLDQVTELVRVGQRGRIPYDVTKAEVDLGNAKVTEVVALHAVGTARAALATAVGLAEILEWTPAAETAPLPVPEGFDAAWKRAAARQPALGAAIARERAASAIVDARVAALYPSLSLDLGYSGGGTKAPFPWSLSLGPSVRWTPFDGFQNLATVDEAVASMREARAGRAQAEQRTWLDVRTAWLALEDARARLDLTALTVRSAEENLRLAQGRFDAGLATSLDLTDARQALIEARLAQIEARADLGIAAARLAQAMGVSARED